MTGLVADIFIDFLIRIFVRSVKSFRSRNWVLVQATVSEASAEPDRHLGCCKVLVSYTYKFQGQQYAEYFRKPFLSHASAEDYATAFQTVTRVEVRVNPFSPADSI